jgi:hypothetical protein
MKVPGRFVFKNAEIADAVMKHISELAPKMNHDCFGDGVLDFLHQRADGGSGWFLSFYRGATFMGVHSKKAPPTESIVAPVPGTKWEKFLRSLRSFAAGMFRAVRGFRG